MVRARVLGVSAYLPPGSRTSVEVGADLRGFSASPGYRARGGGDPRALTGIQQRRVVVTGVDSSDLAAEKPRPPRLRKDEGPTRGRWTGSSSPPPART